MQLLRCICWRHIMFLPRTEGGKVCDDADLPLPSTCTSLNHSQKHAPKEAKFATLPTANAATPTCHSLKRLIGGFEASGPGSAARLLWPSFMTFCVCVLCVVARVRCGEG